MEEFRALAILLVIAGALLLTSSFIFRKNLCDRQEPRCKGWRILFLLNIFFLIGYMAFLRELVNSTNLETYHLLVSGVFCGGGLFVALVVYMSTKTVIDIKMVAEQDHHNALHDALTDLPNRSLLYERIDRAIIAAKRNLCTVSIILLDLDRFKDINDTLGHAVGDQLLMKLAPRLTECVREVDTFARLGGDEFAAVLPTASENDAITVARKISAHIDQPFLINQQSLNVGVSMGIAVYPYHGEDAESLLQRADIAMYQAKRNAQDYAVYDVTSDDFSINRLELVSHLREAVRKKDFRLVYQPKLDILTKKILSAEALLRWEEKDNRGVPPEIFIPIVEHIGLMNELTLWVIAQALHQTVLWHEQGLDIQIAVNVSAKNLSDPVFPNHVQNAIKKTGAAPENLLLEITEGSMLLNPEHALKMLTELSGMGVGLSIDDFGTGYSSLAYLKHLPAVEVKIDQSFVSHILDDENDAVIVCAMIGLAHNLNFKIVAEGVESGEILDFIELWNCDTAQGFHISKPLAADDFCAFVAHRQPVETPHRPEPTYHQRRQYSQPTTL